MQPSIKDIARQLNLAPSTVSRALNGKYGVNPKTRQRILEMALNLGYVANAGARELVSKHSQLVGVLLPYIRGQAKAPFFETFPHIHRQLKMSGKDVIISWLDPLDDDLSTVQQWCRTRNLEGVLVYSGLTESHPVWDVFREQGIPVVAMIDMPASPTISTIATDGLYGMSQAVAHLAQRGHRRIGYVGGIMQLALSEHRLNGFETGMSEAGLSVLDKDIVHSDFSSSGGAIAALHLLRQSPDLTAIVFANDLMAIGGMSALHKHGIRVPEDVSIVGYDGIDVGEYVIPALTTIVHDFEQLGLRMVHRLMEMFAGAAGQAERIHPLLLERDSVQPWKRD